MRDQRILQMQAQNAKRDGRLLAQFTFLMTHQKARELLLRESRLIDRVRWLFFPADFLAAADVLQNKLLNAEAQKMHEAQAAPKIIKPNLVVPG